MFLRAGVLAVVVVVVAGLTGCADNTPSVGGSSPSISTSGTPGACRADQDFVAGILRNIVLLQAQLVSSGASPGAVQADLDAVQQQIDALRQHQFVPQLETAKDQLVTALEQVRTAFGGEASSLPSTVPTALPSSPDLQAALQSLVGAADTLRQAAASCAS
jgi:hypothetical protein